MTEDTEADVDEVEEFLARTDTEVQPIHDETGTVLAVIVGAPEVLDAMVEALISKSKRFVASGNTTLN